MRASIRLIKCKRSGISRGLFVLFASVIAAFLIGTATAQMTEGTVKELHGIVHIERNGHSIDAAPGMPIVTADKIETLQRSSISIELLDGSQLTLSDRSSAVIDRTIHGGTHSKIDLFSGKLRSIINLTVGNPPGLEVHTPNAVAAVRGTDFETEYIEGKPCPGFSQCLRYTDVGVYKGIVEVSNPTSTKPVSVRVAAGYETTVPCELPPARPGPLGIGDLTAPGYH